MEEDAASSDLVIIGAGFAGLTAALRGQERGLRVLLLEAGKGEQYPCNSRYSGGIVHVGFKDIRRSPEELMEAVMDVSANEADRAQAEALTRNIGRWVDWLQRHGARFMRFNMEEAYRWCMAPPRRLVPGPDWDGRGPDRTLRAMMQAYRDKGGRALQGMRAVDLIMEDGSCRGVLAQGEGGMSAYPAAAVLIADGGFQANREAFTSHIGPSFDRVFQRGAANGMGDGIDMAERAGAQITDRRPFYGHLLAYGVHDNEKLWPYPELDAFATAAVIVGPDGSRFTNEGAGGIAVANALARLEEPDRAFAIFDANIWEGPGKAHRIPANPLLEEANAQIHRADSLEELARQIGIPADKLCDTVNTHNRAFDEQGFARLDPPRHGKVAPHPVRTAPFMAIRLVPGITYTMGGIRVDGRARVLREDGTPIAGLFAAGSSTGGLEGGSRSAYIGGISKAGVFGMLAAEEVADRLGTSASKADAAPAKDSSDYPMLETIVRHGKSAAPVLGLIVACLFILIISPLAGWVAAIPSGAMAGLAVYVLVRTLTELVSLIMTMLAPQ